MTSCFPVAVPVSTVILTSDKRAQLAADVNLPWQSLFLRCVQHKITLFLTTYVVLEPLYKKVFWLVENTGDSLHRTLPELAAELTFIKCCF